MTRKDVKTKGRPIETNIDEERVGIEAEEKAEIDAAVSEYLQDNPQITRNNLSGRDIDGVLNKVREAESDFPDNVSIREEIEICFRQHLL